jgi:hypothetical protein
VYNNYRLKRGKKKMNTQKISAIMKKFVNTASDLPFKVRLCKGNRFESSALYGIIRYNLDDPFDITDTRFRNYWGDVWSPFKGFANITQTLLHELGHLETDAEMREIYTFEKRNHDIDKLQEAVEAGRMTEAEHDIAYFTLPDEAKATEWAIEWLKDKRHRQIAKAFEKEFFKCFSS